MTEIFAIFLQLSTFIIIFTFPFTPKVLNKFFSLNKEKLNIIDAHAINIFFFCYVCLFVSFINIDLKIFFSIYFSLSVIFNVFNYQKNNLKFYSSNIILFVIFSLIIFSISFYIAQNLGLEWDGHHWLERVLVFFNNYDIQSIKDVSTYPQYPHLGSYIWAFFWKNSFLELEYLGRLFYPYFYVVSIFVVLNYLKVQNFPIKTFFILFFLLITFEPYLFAGYQEYLIFSTLVIASRFIALVDFKNFKNLKLIYLIVFTLFLNAWFKDEGLVYFILFSSLLVLFINNHLKAKIFLFFLILSLLIFQYILQKYLIEVHGFPHNNILQILTDLFDLKIFFIKIFKIIVHSIISFVKYPLWLIILISILAHVFLIKKINTHIKYFISCFILNFTFLFVLFFSFNNGMDFMLRVTLDRLLFQTSGFYLILFLIMMNNFKIFKK